MPADFPNSVAVDYADGEGEDPGDYPSLQHKLEKA
ncbi:nodulation protein, partial [Halorubrum glutamatedens]